jgi:hypothetical protein
MAYPYLFKLQVGVFSQMPDRILIRRIIEEGVFCLSSRASEGDYRVLLNNAQIEFPLGEYPRAPSNDRRLTDDFVLSDAAQTNLEREPLSSFQNMFVDDEILWIYLICEATDSDHWDHNFLKASEMFQKSCECLGLNFGDIDVYGPLGDLFVFSKYENGEVTDGWGTDEHEGELSGLILDSTGHLQLNNISSDQTVEYMISTYWRV